MHLPGDGHVEEALVQVLLPLGPTHQLSPRAACVGQMRALEERIEVVAHRTGSLLAAGRDATTRAAATASLDRGVRRGRDGSAAGQTRTVPARRKPHGPHTSNTPVARGATRPRQRPCAAPWPECAEGTGPAIVIGCLCRHRAVRPWQRLAKQKIFKISLFRARPDCLPSCAAQIAPLRLPQRLIDAVQVTADAMRTAMCPRVSWSWGARSSSRAGALTSRRSSSAARCWCGASPSRHAVTAVAGASAHLRRPSSSWRRCLRNRCWSASTGSGVDTRRSLGRASRSRGCCERRSRWATRSESGSGRVGRKTRTCTPRSSDVLAYSTRRSSSCLCERRVALRTPRPEDPLGGHRQVHSEADRTAPQDAEDDFSEKRTARPRAELRARRPRGARIAPKAATTAPMHHHTRASASIRRVDPRCPHGR